MIKKNLLFNCMVLFVTCVLMASCDKEICYQCEITARGKLYVDNFCEGNIVQEIIGQDTIDHIFTESDVAQAAAEVESIGGTCKKQ